MDSNVNETIVAAEANRLAAAIDESLEMPSELLEAFDDCVAWLDQYGPPNWHDGVQAPQNW